MWINNPSQDSWFHTRNILWESKIFSVQRKIGNFHKYFCIQKIEKLAYHRSCYKIIGKDNVAGVRHKSFKPTPGDISTWSDYSEQFIFEPGGQLQNEFFDNHRTLSLDSCCLYCFIKTVNVSNLYDNVRDNVHQYNDTVWEFHLHLFDSKLQNAAMTTSHLYTWSAWIIEGGEMIRCGTIWEQTNGCTNQ